MTMKNRLADALYEGWLNEEKLGTVLQTIIPDGDWIHNKAMLDSKWRPDYRSDVHKTVVEFNGPRHYTCPSTIRRDFEKYSYYRHAGYRLVVLPYFLQLKVSDVAWFFPAITDRSVEGMEGVVPFPHGFISDKVILPATFCYAGLRRFAWELSGPLIDYREEILLSLDNRKEHVDDVHPNGLRCYESLVDEE
jgi:hypothetical protein